MKISTRAEGRREWLFKVLLRQNDWLWTMASDSQASMVKVKRLDMFLVQEFILSTGPYFAQLRTFCCFLQQLPQWQGRNEMQSSNSFSSLFGIAIAHNVQLFVCHLKLYGAYAAADFTLKMRASDLWGSHCFHFIFPKALAGLWYKRHCSCSCCQASKRFAAAYKILVHRGSIFEAFYRPLFARWAGKLVEFWHPIDWSTKTQMLSLTSRYCSKSKMYENGVSCWYFWSNLGIWSLQVSFLRTLSHIQQCLDEFLCAL